MNTQTKVLTIGICGETNAGKSSFLNKILGQKISAVTPKVQTTRRQIVGIKTVANVQLIFTDAPGMFYQSKREDDRSLFQEANSVLQENDIILHIIDGRKETKIANGISTINKRIIKTFSKNLKVILLINKSDLISDKNLLLPVIDKFSKSFSYQEIFIISAKNNDGIEKFEEYLQKIALPSPFLYDEKQVTNHSKINFAEEILREKLMLFLRDELPYIFSIQTIIFEESKKNVTINQEILVKNKDHKAMIIGKNASMIKKIGTSCRNELEKIWKTKVRLDLLVKFG